MAMSIDRAPAKPSELSVPVGCRFCEQINMAYQTDIVQHGGNVCDENCRLWMDIEWNQLEIGEFSPVSAKASGFLQSVPKPQAVDLH